MVLEVGTGEDKVGDCRGGDGEDGRGREVSHRGDGRKVFWSEREGLRKGADLPFMQNSMGNEVITL